MGTAPPSDVHEGSVSEESEAPEAPPPPPDAPQIETARERKKRIASEAGNALILRGDPAAVERAKLVTADLDGRDRLQDTIRVVPLNNADAADVVPILQQVAFAIDKRRGLADASEALIASAPHWERMTRGQA